jgi:hypothetical protein
MTLDYALSVFELKVVPTHKSVILKKYRQLAKKYHPDMTLDPSEKVLFNKKFLEIAEAYRLLGNSIKLRSPTKNTNLWAVERDFWVRNVYRNEVDNWDGFIKIFPSPFRPKIFSILKFSLMFISLSSIRQVYLFCDAIFTFLAQMILDILAFAVSPVFRVVCRKPISAEKISKKISKGLSLLAITIFVIFILGLFWLGGIIAVGIPVCLLVAFSISNKIKSLSRDF